MDTEARQIGETLPAVTPGTGAPPPSVSQTESAVFSTVDFAALPDRLDDTQLAQVEAIATATLPAHEPCTDKRMGMFLRCIATLKSRLDDDSTAKLKAALFQRALGGYPNEAIIYLTERVIREFTFYPTAAECLAILREWPNQQFAVRQQGRARARLDRERQARFDEMMARLASDKCSQAEIDALPERWKAVAETRSYLWRHEDGTYTSRVRQ